MKISIDVSLSYAAPAPCDVLLQIGAAALDAQIVSDEILRLSSDLEMNRVAAEEGIGERIWMHVTDELKCDYSAVVDLKRNAFQLEDLSRPPLASLDADIIKYLMPSRYCHPEQFYDFTANEFGDKSGGKQIAAMRDWINENFDYVPGASDAQTTAHDTFKSKEGVCRDYAHVLIAMARAVAIPARLASVYAPDVEPQDFHAVVEVYLDNAWHLVDATGMATPDTMAIIGVGQDAADVAFLTAYGQINLQQQSVCVSRTGNHTS